jgi:hypothetical protein
MNILIQLLSNSVYAYDPVGVIALPTGVPSEISSTTTVISGLIRFIIVIAGIFSLWQFLTGGLAFISSGGDKGKITEAQNKIQMSIVGLVIIAASFIIIAIISQLLFGSFTYILAPNIESIAPATP